MNTEEIKRQFDLLKNITMKLSILLDTKKSNYFYG